MVTEQQKPTILLVSELRGDLLAGEFGRYVRDYEVRTATTAAEAEHHAQDIRGAGGQVALLVTESALPDADVLDALDRWTAVVPTARCLVAAHVEGFLDESEAVRRGLANGAFDAWVLMPRGARDEEFHNAVTELLSDWGSTVAVPEAEAVRIVAPESSALTESIQDFLDRMGIPHRTYAPTTSVGRQVVKSYDGRSGWPLVQMHHHSTLAPTSVRDVAVSLFGRPTTPAADRTIVHDVAIVGAGPSRARGSRLRRIRRPTDCGDGSRSNRRTGWDQFHDPQLPRVSSRHLGNATGRARTPSGNAVRRPVLHGHRGDRTADRDERRPSRAPHYRR